jgi:hypothetical protein
MLRHMRKPKADVTADQLAAMLQVTRRAIDRAIQKGYLVHRPRMETGGKVRFARVHADELKARADEARTKGHKNILKVAVASTPIDQRQEPPKKDMTSDEWMKRLLRKWELHREKAFARSRNKSPP